MKKGWQTKRLGDFAAAVSTGPFGSILHKSDYVDDGVPLVNPTNIVGESIVPDPSKLISEVTIKRLSNYVLEEGDIVVGRRGEIGRCAVVGPSESGWVCGTGSFFIRPLPSLDSQFLAHLIRSPEYREQLEKLSTGATMKNLSNTALGDLVVSIPPLAEQQRIVGLLDEAFEGLATAKANAEKNLQNACTLFESYLQSVFTQRGPGWVEKRLEDVCVIGDGNHSSNYPKKEELVAKGVPFIRSTNLVDGEISDEDMRFLSPEKHAQLKKGHLKTGDILFTNRGEIGKTAIVDAGHEGSNLNSQIAWLRCSETLNNRFLFHVLNSGAIKSHLELSKNGAALQQFTIRQIKELKIPIPPKDQQRALVVSLDGLSSETQRLARLYERKLVALEALKRSLLHQAFSGEL